MACSNESFHYPEVQHPNIFVCKKAMLCTFSAVYLVVFFCVSLYFCYKLYSKSC